MAESDNPRSYLERIAMQAADPFDEVSNEGLRVVLTRIKGVTDKRCLAQPYRFQCPPLDQYTIQRGFDHSQYQTISSGTFSRKVARQLKKLTFNTLIVDWGRFVVTNQYNFSYLTHQLDLLVAYGTPFHVTLSHSADERQVSPEFEMDCILESFQKTEKAGERDARYFDLVFTEWRDPVVTRAARGSAEWPKVITVDKHGVWHLPTPKGHKHTYQTMTLYQLAKIMYGKPSLASIIAKKNKITGWGKATSLELHPRFKKRAGKLIVPQPPVTVKINKSTPLTPMTDPFGD